MFFDRFAEAQRFFENYCVDLVLIDTDDEGAGWEMAQKKSMRLIKG